jgi:hypothetical protein
MNSLEIFKKAGLTDYIKPTLIGSGIGAGLMGLNSYLQNEDDDTPEIKRKRLLNNLLTGAALGGGAGIAYKGISDLNLGGNLGNFFAGAKKSVTPAADKLTSKSENRPMPNELLDYAYREKFPETPTVDNAEIPISPKIIPSGNFDSEDLKEDARLEALLKRFKGDTTEPEYGDNTDGSTDLTIDKFNKLQEMQEKLNALNAEAIVQGAPVLSAQDYKEGLTQLMGEGTIPTAVGGLESVTKSLGGHGELGATLGALGGAGIGATSHIRNLNAGGLAALDAIKKSPPKPSKIIPHYLAQMNAIGAGNPVAASGYMRTLAQNLPDRGRSNIIQALYSNADDALKKNIAAGLHISPAAVLSPVGARAFVTLANQGTSAATPFNLPSGASGWTKFLNRTRSLVSKVPIVGRSMSMNTIPTLKASGSGAAKGAGYGALLNLLANYAIGSTHKSLTPAQVGSREIIDAALKSQNERNSPSLP